MSDLSRLLDDVYRTASPAPALDWSSETSLEDVLANWTPATPVEGPVEPDPAPEAAAEPEVPADELDAVDQIDALLGVAEHTAALVEPAPVAAIDLDLDLDAEPMPEVVRTAPVRPPAAAPLGWTAADDDLLPPKRARRRFRLRRR